ncbi:unnamed protein product [Ceratitis capitata]|uniref:(Mediterranean fruit fly) hypothetical protein n=1 Tax=Ceratitis capitata TaxID=7213 RepID=A0A811USM9_CERCA|nr:unnamed protein product [Ceratitis capitata]
MGGAMGKSGVNFLDALPSQGTLHVVMLGLDSAGKTTALYRLKFDQYLNTVPTIGFNCEKVRVFPLTELNIWVLVWLQSYLSLSKDDVTFSNIKSSIASCLLLIASDYLIESSCQNCIIALFACVGVFCVVPDGCSLKKPCSIPWTRLRRCRLRCHLIVIITVILYVRFIFLIAHTMTKNSFSVGE